MLQIIVPAREMWNETVEQFTSTEEHVLLLEHSLVSLSKWESAWHKPFLSNPDMTYDEFADYVRCMTITQNVKREVYKSLSQENIEQIKQYIDDPMTATTFSKDKNKGSSREVVTSELIYYWMITLGIPFECQKWHINRLLTLIKVCNIKNQPPKKMSTRDIMSRNAALNAARRKRLNSKG